MDRGKIANATSRGWKYQLQQCLSSDFTSEPARKLGVLDGIINASFVTSSRYHRNIAAWRAGALAKINCAMQASLDNAHVQDTAIYLLATMSSVVSIQALNDEITDQFADHVFRTYNRMRNEVQENVWTFLFNIMTSERITDKIYRRTHFIIGDHMYRNPANLKAQQDATQIYNRILSDPCPGHVRDDLGSRFVAKMLVHSVILHPEDETVVTNASSAITSLAYHNTENRDRITDQVDQHERILKGLFQKYNDNQKIGDNLFFIIIHSSCFREEQHQHLIPQLND